MQKKIIALAIAAAFSAPAFADSTVYGIVDAALVNTAKTNMKSDGAVISGGLGGSRIGVVSAEDIDGGMKVIAKIEYKLDVANSAGVGDARQEMLALAGGFGTVAAGYLQTTGYDFMGKFNPVAGAAVDALGAVNPSYLGLISSSSRAQQAAAYISPDMSGLTIAVNHTFNAVGTAMVASGATTGNKTTATLMSATYAAGPLAVGAVYEATANDDTVFSKNTQVAFGGSYDLGVAKILATYNTTKMDATGDAGNTDSAFSLSAVAPVGPGAVVGSFAKNNIKTTTADDNSTAFTVAYLQGLSKTVTAYGALERITKKGTPDDITTTVLALGLKKVF